MSGWALFVELFLVHGVVLGLAAREYFKTDKLIKERRAQEAVVKARAAASEMEALPSQ
jgi:hypothetical protein